MARTAVVLLAALALAGVAQAAPTRGDAEAVLRATFTGGLSIRAHNPDAQGAPSGFVTSPDGVRINPLVDGRSYCEAGWHVISLGFVDGIDATRTRDEALSGLAASDIQFVLDGTPLAAQRTPITVFTDPALFGFDKAYAFNVGALLPPGSLSLGTHQLRATLTTTGFPPDVIDITFYVVSC